ncbi:conserved Plasmodium protein, unknown function [Plasmodium gallinaceum]|uniref:DNA/RNA-binding protein Alba-like domain-containing protein n=1 Tax=Plasmodium gallinaceum TaxID=5849 RepID=A0A1J1GPY8_PLAGA|nr:conserved Plasmodium protein, unknown function [Plasmodium gallinaceum]CRG94364.1 conserved Plasmodium protein, unknown function [Plasmodium gallinaceum]
MFNDLNKKKKKKKKNEITIETIQKENSPILKKKNIDIYITSNKSINIYYERILKILNNSKEVDNIIEGNNKINNLLVSNNEVHIYAVGTNIIKASYLVQDLIKYYYLLLKNIQDSSKKNIKKKIDIYSFIDIKVNSKTLIMNDNVILNKFLIKEEFLSDNYDDLINFSKQSYNQNFHKYIEKNKERRLTNVIISLKKKNVES